MFGIPAALWVDRRIKSKEAAAEYKKERERERGILLLIKEELEFSQQGLEARRTNPSALMSQPFKTDIWESISAGEMLEFIESLTLLNRVASAYYVLRIVQRIEAQCHAATRSATVTFSGGRTAAQLLLEDAQGFYELLENNVNKAIEKINNRISQLPSVGHRGRGACW